MIWLYFGVNLGGFWGELKNVKQTEGLAQQSSSCQRCFS
jgi:hypothetical protein